MVVNVKKAKTWKEQVFVIHRCSVKKGFLEISQNPHENNYARGSFLIKFQPSARPEQHIAVMSNRSNTFETFCLRFSVFASEEQLEKLNLQSLFMAKIPFGG